MGWTERKKAGLFFTVDAIVDSKTNFNPIFNI